VDITGDFVASFIICGTLIACGGFICLPVRRVAKWEENREKNRKKNAADGSRGGYTKVNKTGV